MSEQKPLIVAIDGPAASGKGTVARRLAEHLGAVYLDTGKLYRAVGYQVLEAGKAVKEAENHDSEVAQYAVEMAKKLKPGDLEEEKLGDEGVGEAASIVSAIPAVRDALLDFQREVAKSSSGAVLDGRDIGTVVCPEADFKFFITASLEARAERRTKQLQNQGKDVIYTKILEDLAQRDQRDMERKAAPLVAAEGAITLDTTDLNIDEVFLKIRNVVDP